MDKQLEQFSARLLAESYLPRTDKMVRRALTDELFRQDLDQRLAQCGLYLLENPYADYVALGLKRENEEAVFGGEENWLNNNMGLSRDAVALLVVLWSLLILPKRERQIIQREQASPPLQTGLLDEDKKSASSKIAKNEDAAQGVAESTLYADFAEQLGGKARVGINLGTLSRVGLIQRRNKIIYEGPLLDLLLDYSKLAPRIINGALADILAQQRQLIEANE